MSCESVMMRMRNRARNGAVGESRLETVAHGASLIRTLLQASTARGFPRGENGGVDSRERTRLGKKNPGNTLNAPKNGLIQPISPQSAAQQEQEFCAHGQIA